MNSIDTYPKMTAVDKKAIKADPRFKKLCSDMYAVWQECGSDAYQLAEECGERMTISMKIETCLDADRMTTIANAPDSDKYVGELITKFGYRQIEKFLGKEPDL